MSLAAPRRPGARHIELRLEILPGNRLRISTPQARGHALVARGPLQLWGAVLTAFREATIAGYANWRGEHYDHDALTERDDPTEPPRRSMPDADELARRRAVSYARDAVVRPDQANPAEWTPNEDGSWTSPNGRRWTSAKVLVPLLIKRGRMGLSTTFEEWVGQQETAEVAG